jgi:hypothetical protein
MWLYAATVAGAEGHAPFIAELPFRDRSLLGLRQAVAALDERAQLFVAVASLLDGERRAAPGRHLLALAIQVVVVAPGLGAGRQDLEQQAAAVGERVRTTVDTLKHRTPVESTIWGSL